MSHPRRLFSRRFPTSSFFCAWRRRLSVRLHCSLVLLAMRIIFVLNILLLWRHAWARPAMSMDWSLPEEDFTPTSPKISATDRPTSSLAQPTSTKSPSETASASGSVASDSFPLDGQIWHIPMTDDILILNAPAVDYPFSARNLSFPFEVVDTDPCSPSPDSLPLRVGAGSSFQLHSEINATTLDHLWFQLLNDPGSYTHGVFLLALICLMSVAISVMLLACIYCYQTCHLSALLTRLSPGENSSQPE